MPFDEHLSFDPTFLSRNDHTQFGSQTYREPTRSSVEEGSALQSTRTYNNIYTGTTGYEPSPLISGRQYGLNLESTQELRAFVTIDLAKINKDRQNQLKLALEDNYREKESQLLEIEATYRKQREEYNSVGMKLEHKSRLLDGEISKQREHMNDLKKMAAQIDAEQQLNERGQQAFLTQNMLNLKEVQNQLAQVQEMQRQKESERQMLQIEKHSIEQRIDLKNRMKMHELDQQIQPLCDEKDQFVLNLELLEQNLSLLEGVRLQNENEKIMIEEDLTASNQQKLELIYQREDIEQFIEKTRNDNTDLRFLTQTAFDEDVLSNYPKWCQTLEALVAEKQRCLILDLIRELHQYILGVSSNTTDMSVMQSDELEELQGLIENKSITVDEAAELVSNFAMTKIKIDLSVQVLQEKLATIADNIDRESLRSQLQEMRGLEQQMNEIDQKIKVITNRCQNELAPRQKALVMSEGSMSAEIVTVKDSIDIIKTQIEEINEKIDEVQIVFEQTMPLHADSDDQHVNSQTLKNQFSHLQDAIEEITCHIVQLSSTKEELQLRANELESEKQQAEFDQVEKREFLNQQYNSILNEIKKEKSSTLQFEFTNPLVQQLTREVAQLKCDKESFYKRLKYIEAKLGNAKDSVSHAKSVLDDHILQIQQEQLNLKVTQSNSGIQFKKRMGSLNQGQMPDNQQMVQRRPQNFAQKSVCLPSGQNMLTMPHPYEENNDRRYIQKTELIPSRVMPHQSQRDIPLANQPTDLRLHSHFIEPLEEDSKSAFDSLKQYPPLKNLQKSIATTIPYTDNHILDHQQDGQSKFLSQKNREMIQAYLQKEKSDIVKYKQESSAAFSQSQMNQQNDALSSSQISSNNNYKLHIAQTLNQINVNSGGEHNSRSIPIQTFITPREPLNDMQHNHSHQISLVSQPNQYEISQFGTYRHSQSIGSADDDSIYQQIIMEENKRNSLYLRSHQSVQMNTSPALQTLQSTLQHGFSQYQQQDQKVPSVKISLRHTQNNSVDDSNNQQSLASSMRSSMTYKENIPPNILLSNSQTSSSLNLRKLTQVASLSSIQPVSKPPAVPSSKGVSQPFYIMSESLQTQQNQGDSSKKSRQHMPHQSFTQRNSKGQLIDSGIISISSHSSQFNSNRSIGSQSQLNGGVVTKMRLCQNSNNGKILGTGIVDLSKCNQSLIQKDIQFFENIKPLIEGASFLCQSSKHGHSCHTKYIFLDFSLLRLFLNLNNSHSGTGDRREVLMIDTIMKTDLPQSTLEMINNDKQNQQTTMSSDHYHQSTFGSGKRYEFQIILNNNGIAERIQLFTHSFEELRAWVIGINALITNKNNLMRLSSMIKMT